MVPSLKKIFDKSGPKKAAAAEAVKTFDESKVRSSSRNPRSFSSS